MKRSIRIIGNGVVGNATGRVLKELGHTVHYYDKDRDKSDTPATLEEYDWGRIGRDKEIVMICLPTPTHENGCQDVSQIAMVVRHLAREKFEGIVVIRSTILPGSCDEIKKHLPELKLVHFPEFLRQKHAFYDELNPDRLIMSGKMEDVGEVFSLYEGLPNTKYIPRIFSVNYKFTEMAKYANNYFLAAKVSIANEIYDMCQETGVEYGLVREAMYADRRIGNTHLEVTKWRGYNGHCLPKDMKALNWLFPDAQILKTVIKYNDEVKHEAESDNQK